MRTAQSMYANMSQLDYALGFRKLPKEEKEEHNLIHQIQLLSGILNREYSIDKYQELQSALSEYESKYGIYELNHYQKTINDGEQISLF